MHIRKNKYNKKNVLVFGAAGFVGTYLIDELIKKGYPIVASDISKIGEKYYRNNNIPYIPIDITNDKAFDKLPQTPFNAVIHLAAHQPANVSANNYDLNDYINVNVIGTLNILKYCRKNEVGKIIYACSHRSTQGLWKKNRALREEDGRSIKYDGEYSMFSISESAAQDCIEHYSVQYGLKSIIFRLPLVYGYGPHTEIFKGGKPIKTGFQIFIENAMACTPLKVWGDSAIGRDIIYVKDVVSALMKAINNKKAHGLFNIASGKAITLRQEAETIAKVFWGDDTEPKIIEQPEKPNHMDAFVYDISKAKRELDWIPQYSFEEMLLDYINEGNRKKFFYLIEKRRKMNEES